jgi:arylsulfatase A-like enzyme
MSLIMKKYLLIIALIVIIVGLVVTAVVSKKEEKKPAFNIILISIDTLRADHLGCYNYPRNTSPNIDKFREDAVLFRRCIVQSSSTLASHASMLTSLILSHHRAYFTRSQALSDYIMTAAEYLKGQGFHTVSFNDGGQIAPEFGLNRGFDLYESRKPGKPSYHQGFKAIVDRSLAWLDSHSGGTFFMFLHTYETHHPYTPADEHLKLFEKDYKGSLPKDISVPLIKRINNGEVPLLEEDKQHIINTYDAEIRSMDESFGRLIRYLQEKKLYAKTMIVFTSDHGEEFGEHGVWGMHSHTLFNDQLHVPLIVKFPASRFAALNVKPMVRSIDIFPTLVDMLGGKMQEQFEGVSLMPLVRGEKSSDTLIAISQRDMQKTFVRNYWSVIKGKWKLYDSRLYDLLKDPGELTDVSGASAANREIKNHLERFAMNFMRRKMRKFKTKKIKVSDELKKKLETLGYIGK